MRFRDFDPDTYGYRPPRPDGTEWPHVLVLHDGSTVRADTAAEILTELLPGYDTLTHDARLTARIAHAHDMATKGQDVLIDRARSAGAFDPASPDDAAALPILHAHKEVPLLLGTPDTPHRQTPWVGAVPLLLVTTSYAPHTDVPPAQGRILWLDPTDDRRYLTSLHTARLFDYWTEDAHPTT